MTLLTRVILLAVMAAGLLDSVAAAAGDPAKTKKLIAVLQSDAVLFEKARACQQLGEIGDADAVPALVALLADDHLNAYARSGLEGIPDPSAAAALRAAAGTLKGNPLAGVINSLGVLRDAQAVGLLNALATDPGSGVVKEALLALGRIANEEAIRTLCRTLAEGPETSRPDAAAACLLAAEKQLADGHTDTAVSLYDAVRNANVPAPCRAGAMRGAILARKSAGPDFLVPQLRSDDRAIRDVALMTIREIPSDSLASALNAEMDRPAPELQIRLLLALVNCHNAQSIQVVKAKADSNESEVRQTALTVLGQIGGPAEVGVFLKAVVENRSAEETAAALSSLGRMEGTDVDAQVLQALSSAQEAAARIRLVRVVGGRGMTNATAELLKQAADPDTKLSVAALGALKSVASSRELPALIVLIRSCKDEAVREAAEDAIVSICAKSGDPKPGAELVLAELTRATDPIERNSWMNILTSLGCARALPIIKADLGSANDQVAAKAIDHLGHWPDPAPVEDLLKVVETGTNPARSKRALGAVIRLATVAAEEHQRPDEVIVGWLQRADKAAQTIEDRRLILSAFGRLNSVESLRSLARHLADAGLENEAATAIVQISPALAKKQGDAAALKGVLEQIAATTKSTAIRQQAEKIAGTIRIQPEPSPLFDGRSLAGWEGNTNVWRVRDGVIVGGSMEGNPMNEFLATTRGYTNFVLRLDYKLVGTSGFINGGVQFRSLRVQQPPNEMSGFQADIGAGYSGFLYDESRRNKVLARPTDEQIKGLEKPGGWNRYEVRCAGPRIQIVLNGVKTVDYTETDPAIPLDGLIAPQIHGGCKAEISFRNITIEDL